MDSDSVDQIREQIRHNFPSGLRKRDLDESVWWALEIFSAVVEKYEYMYRKIDGDIVKCKLDFVYDENRWDFNAAAGPWGIVKFDCGVPLTLLDACLSLANNPTLWAYEGHTLKVYEACGFEKQPFIPDYVQMYDKMPELAKSLFTAASRFVAGHEVSHLFFGHVFMPKDNSHNDEVIEYQADTFAADLCTRPDALTDLYYGRNDDERWRLAVAGAMLALALIAKFSGVKQPGYPRMQTRWLTMLWMLFSKRYYPDLQLGDALWRKIISDALTIKWLFQCDWLEPIAIIQLYTRRDPTEEGLVELQRLTSRSDEALSENGWQAKYAKMVDQAILNKLRLQ